VNIKNISCNNAGKPQLDPWRAFAMPTISMFYGIIISLYFYDDERHKLPHIHAKYQGQDAAFSILMDRC